MVVPTGAEGLWAREGGGEVWYLWFELQGEEEAAELSTLDTTMHRIRVHVIVMI